MSTRPVPVGRPPAGEEQEEDPPTFQQALVSSLVAYSPSTAFIARSAALAFVIVSSLCAAIVAWIVFYRAFSVDWGRDEQVWLQFGNNRAPYYELPLLPTGSYFATDQPYDVSLELIVPVSRRNIEIGNFMVSFTLYKNDGTTLVNVSRPGTLTHQHPVSLFLHSFSPLRLLGFRRSPVERLAIPLLHNTVLQTRLRKPVSGEVAVGRNDAHTTGPEKGVGWKDGMGELQVYKARLRFVACLSGLRYMLYYHSIFSFFVFTFFFTFIELVSAAILWAYFVHKDSPYPFDTVPGSGPGGGDSGIKIPKVEHDSEDEAEREFFATRAAREAIEAELGASRGVRGPRMEDVGEDESSEGTWGEEEVGSGESDEGVTGEGEELVDVKDEDDDDAATIGGLWQKNMSTPSNKRQRSPVSESTPLDTAPLPPSSAGALNSTHEKASVDFPPVPEFTLKTWATTFRKDLWNQGDRRYVDVWKDEKGQEYKLLRHKMDLSQKIQHSVLVLGEWERIYDYVSEEAFCELASRGTGGLIVGGQAGLGKSTLLRYLLARALNEGTPVLFIRDVNPTWLLFHADGVTLIPPHDQTQEAMAEHCDDGRLLALVDVDLVPTPNLLIGLPLRIVQAASPKKIASAYGWTKKREETMMWIVDPWSSREVNLVANSIPVTPFSKSTPGECAKIVGLVPRRIFAQNRDVALYEFECTNIVDELFVVSTPTSVLNLALGLMQDRPEPGTGVHKIFHVRRPASLSRPSPTVSATILPVFFASPFIEQYFYSKLAKLELDVTLQHLTLFAALPHVAGFVFEAAAVKLFAAGLIGVFHGSRDITLDDSSRTIATSTPFSYPINNAPTSQPVEFNPTNWLLLVDKYQLYVPPVGFATLDAFASNDDGLYIFQMTIAKRHSLKKAGLEKLLAALPDDVRRLDRHFIFVVPSKATGERLVTSALRGTKTSLPVINKFKLKIGYLVLTERCDDSLNAFLPEDWEEEDDMNVER
ncbi:hypothetical protein MNV49_004224 [Pseudohyphozyma bogoriensis]|nr:hypothetical protein MNV49_004224 [Pseudohyphozyma bogoriensis]